MAPKFLGVVASRHADDEAEFSRKSGLYSRKSVLDDDRPRWFDAQQPRCHQEGIWGGLAGEMLLLDRDAVDARFE